MNQPETVSIITKAQHRLLDRLIEWELSLATLYSLYAELFPDDQAFWQRLSKEEKFHAKILKPMHEVIDEGYLLNNIGEFHEERISSEVKEVKRAIQSAKEKWTTPEQATKNAMIFETSVIDSQFYAVVQCDSPIFEKVAAVHAKHGGQHANEVRLRWEAMLDQKSPI